jgi:methyl-accepting chemotaxis protein
MHMYFFACLTITAAWLDWRPLVAYTGMVAVHHLLLALTLPALVFPDGGGLDRVFLHAAIIVLETAVLIWITARLRLALAASDMLLKVEAAQAETEGLRGEAEARALKEVRRSQAIEAQADQFRSDVSTISQEIEQSLSLMSGTATSLGMLAESTSRGTFGVTQSSSEVTACVELVSQECAGLVDSIQAIAQHVTATDLITDAANADARQSGETVTLLDDCVTRVGSVIELIRNVASQTNLLALNATIEAARAGEAGRGFSVVASEVKTLAGQTARATEEIASQIQAIQTATHAAVNSMRAFTGRVLEIKTSMAAITAAVDQQRATTQNINSTIDGAVQRANTANVQVGEVARTVDGTRAAANDVEASSAGVRRCTEELQTIVHRFLNDLRAA